MRAAAGLKMLLLIVAGTFALPGAANAAPPQSALITALDNCRKIADAAQRLACFDRSSATLVAASRSGEISVVDRGQLRQARRSLFGFSMPKLPFFAGDESGADTPQEIETTIRAAGSVGNGRYRIVIAEGGAQWETTERSLTLREPRAGQKISIRRGPLGSYFLRIDGQRGIKGKRVG